MISKKTNNLNNIFYFFNFLSIFKLFNTSFRVGIIASILILFFLVLNNKKIVLDKKNIVYYIYIFINIFSIYGYYNNDISISLYFAGWSYNIIPAFLYILGSIYSKNEDTILFRKLLTSNIILLGIGLILFILKPEFYSNYQISSGVPLYHRLESYVGSLVVGSVSLISIPLFFYCLKELSILKKYMYLLIIIISILLSMQRSAWIMGVILLIMCSLYYFYNNNQVELLIKYFVVLFIVVLSLSFFTKIFMTDEFLTHFLRRINSFGNGMVSSRSNQWGTAINTFLEHPFGIGVGSAGNKATLHGIGIVPDGNYFRILVETGFIGFISFVCLNIQGLYNSSKNNLYFTFIIVAFLFQAIGSNVFDFYYSSFIYWFVLGYAVNYKAGEDNII